MKIIEYFKPRAVRGEVGIEIELEGNGIRGIDVAGWRMEDDGSLRGESVELVLPKPIPRNTVRASVNRIVKAVERAEAEVKDTGRAGVHIHVNVQDLTMTQVFNFVCAYMIFEDTLINFCGEHRVGNLFCLRVRDADALLRIIREAIVNETYEELQGNHIKYASINLCALGNYGSLEFRAMRSTIDPDLVDTWANMLCRIKDWAMGFDDPRDIIMEFSQQGPERILQSVFGKYREYLNLDPQELYDGVRNAQYIAFCTEDWDLDLYEKMRRAAQEMRGFNHADTVMVLLSSRKKFFEDVVFSRHVMHELQKFIDRKHAGIEEPRMKKPFDQPQYFVRPGGILRDHVEIVDEAADDIDLEFDAEEIEERIEAEWRLARADAREAQREDQRGDR